MFSWRNKKDSSIFLRRKSALSVAMMFQLSNAYLTSIVSHNVRKCTFWHVRQTKTQISMRNCAVWLESLMSAWRNFAPLDVQKMRQGKIHIRLRERAGWYESLLGAHFRSYVLAGHTFPKLRFCLAHISEVTFLLGAHFRSYGFAGRTFPKLRFLTLPAHYVSLLAFFQAHKALDSIYYICVKDISTEQVSQVSIANLP